MLPWKMKISEDVSGTEHSASGTVNSNLIHCNYKGLGRFAFQGCSPAAVPPPGAYLAIRQAAPSCSPFLGSMDKNKGSGICEGLKRTAMKVFRGPCLESKKKQASSAGSPTGVFTLSPFLGDLHLPQTWAVNENQEENVYLWTRKDSFFIGVPMKRLN